MSSVFKRRQYRAVMRAPDGVTHCALMSLVYSYNNYSPGDWLAWVYSCDVGHGGGSTRDQLPIMLEGTPITCLECLSIPNA